MRFLLIVPAVLLISTFWAVQQASLPAIEKLIAEQHPVDAITHQQLAQILASDSAKHFLVFDVRQREEFEVSHLKNAVQVDPKLSADDFFEQHGDVIADKHLVFYCSVGYRSSIFIEQIRVRAQHAGSGSLQNLTGGIFRWYNERLPVFNRLGKTDKVHPYDALWGKLLIQKFKKMDAK